MEGKDLIYKMDHNEEVNVHNVENTMGTTDIGDVHNVESSTGTTDMSGVHNGLGLVV